MHEEIGENRAHYSPLRSAAASLDDSSILLHNRRYQPSFDVEQRPLALYMLPDSPQQKLVVNVVRQSLDIEL